MALVFVRDASIRVNRSANDNGVPGKDSFRRVALLWPGYRSAIERGQELANALKERASHRASIKISIFSSFLFKLVKKAI
jgi:hypothetical protein